MKRETVIELARNAGSIDSEEVIETVFSAFTKVIDYDVLVVIADATHALKIANTYTIATDTYQSNNELIHKLDVVLNSQYVSPSKLVAARGVPDVQAMVNRFLGWKLPQDFAPDGSITFHLLPSAHSSLSWPVGTNLLTADQAKAMFEYCLSAAPAQPNALPNKPQTYDGADTSHMPKFAAQPEPTDPAKLQTAMAEAGVTLTQVSRPTTTGTSYELWFNGRPLSQVLKGHV